MNRELRSKAESKLRRSLTLHRDHRFAQLRDKVKPHIPSPTSHEEDFERKENQEQQERIEAMRQGGVIEYLS